MKRNLDLRKLNKAFFIFLRCRIKRYRTKQYKAGITVLLALLVSTCALTYYIGIGQSGIDTIAVATSPVIVNAAEPESEITSMPIESEKAEQKKYATSHKEVLEEYAISNKDDEDNQEPLTESPLPLSDIYAEPDSIAVFKCYYPDAVNYVWEIYDQQTDKWKAADDAEVVETTDELYRQVSTFFVPADEGGQTIRCRAERKTGDDISGTATLHIMSDIKDISAKEYISDAGRYISTREIPLLVSYKDGREETITGLNGLYFLEKEETSEQGTTDSGSMKETITTVLTTYDYVYLDGDKEGILRYQGKKGNIDVPIRLIGEDRIPPEIKELSFSDFEISTIDQPIPVTVTIVAEDDITAYPNLQYAFLPDGEEPQDDVWTKQPTFSVDITQNGKWIAYCRDESGNKAQEEKDIIVVDNKAPVVSLSLEENETWCTENKILVDAKDGLSIEYCYSCPQTGEDSGWSTKNEFVISQNGTWIVKVRDAVGNMTEEEITIDNIDNHAPVIRGITEKRD